MKKIITITLICLCCFITACSCISEPVTSFGDITSPTEVVSSTEESEKVVSLTVEEILTDEFNRKILDSVGVKEIKEAVIEKYPSGNYKGYIIRIIDMDDNTYYISCNSQGGIDEICRDSIDGESIFYVLP